MKRIIKNNLSPIEKFYSDGTLEILSNFVTDLLRAGEITLTMEALRTIDPFLKDEDNRSIFSAELHATIVRSEDAKLLENYFKLLPFIAGIYQEFSYDDDDIIDEIYWDGMGFDTVEHFERYVTPFLTAAINSDRKGVVEYIINLWDSERGTYDEDPANKRSVNKMDKLIKQAQAALNK